MLRNGLEPWHLLLVVIVAIVLFGSKKLPDTARALGKSLRILKSETRAMKDDGAASPSPSPADGTPAPAAASGPQNDPPSPLVADPRAADGERAAR